MIYKIFRQDVNKTTYNRPKTILFKLILTIKIMVDL